MAKTYLCGIFNSLIKKHFLKILQYLTTFSWNRKFMRQPKIETKINTSYSRGGVKSAYSLSIREKRAYSFWALFLSLFILRVISMRQLWKSIKSYTDDLKNKKVSKNILKILVKIFEFKIVFYTLTTPYSLKCVKLYNKKL